jgi:hypothetical protein
MTTPVPGVVMRVLKTPQATTPVAVDRHSSAIYARHR